MAGPTASVSRPKSWMPSCRCGCEGERACLCVCVCVFVSHQDILLFSRNCRSFGWSGWGVQALHAVSTPLLPFHAICPSLFTALIRRNNTLCRLAAVQCQLASAATKSIGSIFPHLLRLALPALCGGKYFLFFFFFFLFSFFFPPFINEKNPKLVVCGGNI